MAPSFIVLLNTTCIYLIFIIFKSQINSICDHFDLYRKNDTATTDCIIFVAILSQNYKRCPKKWMGITCNYFTCI